MKPLLILGIGNPLLGDGGLGPKAIAALRQLGGLPAGVRLADGGAGGGRLLPELEGADRVILVEGVDLGAPPGAICRITGDGIEGATHPPAAVEDAGIREAFALCRLHGTLPKEVVLFAEQVARIAPGTELSPEVDAALPDLLKAVAREARRMERTNAREFPPVLDEARGP